MCRTSPPVRSVSWTRRIPPVRIFAPAPALVDLIAKDQLGFDVARALTLTDSHNQQMKVCKAANLQVHAIRRMLTTEKVATTSDAFLFVGADVYAEKGDTITPDLLSEVSAGYADH